MSKVVKIHRGLDIKLKGKAEKVIVDAGPAETYAVKPPDFIGVTPKMLVKPEDTVRVGTPLFFDKQNPAVLFVSPVSGTVLAVNRGERRRILEVTIRPDKDQKYETLVKGNPAEMTRDQVKDQILSSGLWPAITQRPYGVIANPAETPRDIFISGFDSSPLGVDYDLILRDEEESFKTGIQALRLLTEGKVFLGLNGAFPVSKTYSNLDGVEYTSFHGPHPAGNVGVHIHHLAPINKGDVVWTIQPQHIALIGRTFLQGKLDPTLIVALAGSMISRPRYMRTIMGASIASLYQGNLKEHELPSRFISGNALTGTQVDGQGYLGFYSSLLSVIPEGSYYELFGWVMPGLKKFSKTRAFFSWLTPGKEWEIDTNLKGGKRAFVMTGQYDKVIPMDILPVHLLKAILVEDIDKMEQLGIYEVIEEDLALCEFVCTSKTDVQEILRKGLDLIRKEMS